MTEPRIIIATPVYGTPDTASVSAGYHMTIAALVRDSHFTIMPAVYGCDLVRGRSRLVRQFLEETDATHLLFWDEDVVCSADQAGRLIARMVESGHDLVACTYPKKRVHVDRLADAHGQLSVPEREDVDMAALYRAHAHEYAYTASVAHPCINGAIEVDAVPMGFALMRRDALARMVEEYTIRREARLVYTDEVGGKTAETVALFQLMIRGGQLLGEDYSFCARWRDIGGKVHLWAGHDCELTHVGAHAYQGAREGYVRG